MEQSLRKESHRNFTKNIHIKHWKQLHEPVIPKDLSLVIARHFEYTQEQGWAHSHYPYIPPKHGDNPVGFDYAREQPLAEFFNDFAAFCARVAGLQGGGRTWVSQHNTFIGGRRKPDLVLLDHRLQTSTEKWEHVRSICQVRYKDTPDLAEDAFEQLYDNTFFIFTAQDNRLFFIGFTMCGANLRAYLFHRGAQVLIAIAHAPFDKIGYDATITTPDYSMMHPRWRLITTYMTAEEELSVMDLQLLVDTCLFSSHSVQGRETHVFACHHPYYSRNAFDMDEKGKEKEKGQVVSYQDPTHLVVKDCWVDRHDCTDSYIHSLLKVRNMERPQKEGKEDPQLVEPEGIPVYLAGHVDAVTVLPPNANPDVEAPDKNSSYFRTHLLKSLRMRTMIHKRFVFETCGVSLPWFATRKEFINAILGAVQECSRSQYPPQGRRHAQCHDGSEGHQRGMCRSQPRAGA
ncbi:hypothetical protein M405DRAFT_146544 [Rhizopogon salebrosus TDB-379]|nr:hypothetical protein M405DRAFT_146544 [Rhizopogon salebrosus TDB-379]